MSNVTGTNTNELESIDNSYWLELNEALDRLYNNDDFKKVIIDGYFQKKAVEGVSLLATDYVIQNNQRGSVMEELVAISNLQDYFRTIRNLGFVPEDDEE